MRTYPVTMTRRDSDGWQAAERTRVVSGGSSLWVEGAELVDLVVEGVRVADRIYVALRDEAWNTVQPSRVVLHPVVSSPDGVSVRLSAEYSTAAAPFLVFDLVCRLEGESAVLELSSSFLADTTFSKFGLCVHHPGDLAGQPLWASCGSQLLAETSFPTLVSTGITYGELTPAFDSLAHMTSAGDQVTLRFRGDLFEMQDHRNWCDDNFKSYGTPLSVPFPRTLRSGEQLTQGLDIAVTPGSSRDVGYRFETPLVGQLVVPNVGLRLSRGEGHPLGALSALQGMSLQHIRADITPDADPGAVLSEASMVAVAADCAIEVVVDLVDRPEQRLRAVATGLSSLGAPVARVLVFDEPPGFNAGHGTTSAASLALAIQILGVPVVGGTDTSFGEANRTHAIPGQSTGVVYPICPQVHVCADTALMANLNAIPSQIATLRDFAGGADVHIGSLDLVGALGPFPAGPDLEHPAASNHDPRYRTGIAAAWLAGALTRLSAAQVASVTCFETVGPRGVIQVDTAAASTTGEGVTSDPSARVLAWFACRAGQKLELLTSSLPTVYALQDERGRCLVVNEGFDAVTVRFEGSTGLSLAAASAGITVPGFDALRIEDQLDEALFGTAPR